VNYVDVTGAEFLPGGHSEGYFFLGLLLGGLGYLVYRPLRQPLIARAGSTRWRCACVPRRRPVAVAVPGAVRRRFAPGDLIFRNSPISHVALYIGGGNQIAATHTGSTVKLQSAFGGNIVGYSRPIG